MSDSSNQFKKAPKRKAAKGKSVTVSAETKQAYADLMREREAKEQAYGQHMPPDMKR